MCTNLKRTYVHRIRLLVHPVALDLLIYLLKHAKAPERVACELCAIMEGNIVSVLLLSARKHVLKPTSEMQGGSVRTS